MDRLRFTSRPRLLTRATMGRLWVVVQAALGFVILEQSGAAADEARLTATDLRCEYRVDPLGVDVEEPRLSWIVEAAERGQKQTAYRVLVASEEAALKEDKGDLWDSGKVEGDDTICIPYAGRPLTSHQRCLWKVKVWDRDGHESAWSEPALWSMGMLHQDDWRAEWIGFDTPRESDQPEDPFPGVSWIWYAGDKGPNKPQGFRWFVGEVKLPEGVNIRNADLYVTADDTYAIALNGTLVIANDAGNFKKPKRVDVTSEVQPGQVNTIRAQVGNLSKGPAGLLARLVVTTEDGRTISLVTDGSWKSSAEPGGEDWYNRPLDSAAWPAAQVVGAYGGEPWGKVEMSGPVLPAPAYLCSTFTTDKPLRRATLYATALGLCDLHLNGERVGDDFFLPGWTDYTRRVYYRAYDVTDRVRQGENALGAIVADGWFSGYVGYGGQRDHYGQHPRFLAQLHLEYEDGSTAEVATGPDWKGTIGPIREADFLMGETYDARRELVGWNAPGYKADRWEDVAVGAEVDPAVQWHPGPPVRAIEEFRAAEITEPRPGVFVLNLGQNFAGVPRLTVSGKRGQRISLRFAEQLNADGTVYTANLRTARATDSYTCRGDGPETWTPRFTFHGFQYIEVTGLTERPSPDTVVGVALSSDTPVVGSFECSDPMINRLYRNIIWTQRANFIDIPTDCPQRDERLGWTGDAQVYIRTATLNTDVQAFFTKWLIDLEDAQREDGQFPMVAPLKVAGADGGPAWADAGVICPWTLFDVYGDRRELARHYESMTRFIDFCQQRCTPDLLPPPSYHCFGDWLSINAETPHDVIATAYFAHSTDLTSRAAEVLGRTDDAARYRELFDRIKAAFNRAYVAEDGRVRGDTQTGYVLALAYDLLDGPKRDLAAKHLIEGIEARDWHLSTGFIGTKDLMLVLAQIGRNDVAYRLLFNTSFPSWGFSVQHGATSIWERWDGWTPEKGFQTPGMNSFAHYSFGAVDQWMVENIGGIRAEAPSYSRIRIAPEPNPRLTSARVSYLGIRGEIASAWTRRAGTFTLDVTIPPNTTATVSLPATARENVTEGDRPLDQAEGVTFLRMDGDRAVLSVEPGRYQFASRTRP